VKRNRQKVNQFFNEFLFFPEEFFSLFTWPVRRLQYKAIKYSKTRFVFVVSLPRSGTTALGSLINQAETEVNYFGEIFNLVFGNKVRSRFFPFFPIRYRLGVLVQGKKWSFNSLQLNPDKALSALANTPGTHVLKIFPDHVNVQTLESIMEKFEPDILFLRRNHLDRLVSLKKVEATGRWHGINTESVEIEIDENELSKFISSSEDFYRQIYMRAVSRSLKIMDVDYESLFHPDVISEVLNFIVGDPKKVKMIEMRPRTLKQDSGNASQQSYLSKVSSDGVKKTISDYNFDRFAG